MIRFLKLSIMVLSLTIFGCGKSEEPKSTHSAAETVVEKGAEESHPPAGAVKETTGAVVGNDSDIEKQAEPVVQDLVEKTMKKTTETVNIAEEMARQAAGETTAVVTEAKEATSAAIDTAAKKATSTATAITMTAGEAAGEAKQAVGPETIVLEASYGNVTFPHEIHAGAYDCAICHGKDAPGLFGLDKEKAHTLCKGCHKQEGAGPTACKGCHKK